MGMSGVQIGLCGLMVKDSFFSEDDCCDSDLFILELFSVFDFCNFLNFSSELNFQILFKLFDDSLFLFTNKFSNLLASFFSFVFSVFGRIAKLV